MKRLSFVYHLSSLLAFFVLFLFLIPKSAHAAVSVSFSSSSTVTTASGFVGDTGNTVYVKGGGLITTYTIYWDSTATGKTVSLGTCATGIGTTCNLAITIPHSSKGNWLIHANTGNTNSAAITFTVNPKITSATPSSGNKGTAVSMTGTGFAAETVTGKLDTYSFDTDTPTSGTGGTHGDLSESGTAPAMPAGSHTYNASGSSSGNVSSSFTFTMNPTISESSSGGFPGQSTAISGDGFAASAPITITQNSSDTIYTTTTNSDGSFSNTTFYPTGSSGGQNIGAHDNASHSAPTITYTLTQGILSVATPSSATLNAVTIAANTVTGTGSLGTITVTDQRGTLVGWNLVASSTNFYNVNQAALVSGSHNTVTRDTSSTYNSSTAGTYTITITTGGAVGTAKFGVTGLETAANQTTGAGVSIGTQGVKATFATATYAIGDSWTIRVDLVPVTGFTITPGSATLVQGPFSDATGGSAHTFTSTVDSTSLLSAASGHGSGIFSVAPSLSLAVPVGSYAGNYTATITETVN